MYVLFPNCMNVEVFITISEKIAEFVDSCRFGIVILEFGVNLVWGLYPKVDRHDQFFKSTILEVVQSSLSIFQWSVFNIVIYISKYLGSLLCSQD